MHVRRRYAPRHAAPGRRLPALGWAAAALTTICLVLVILVPLAVRAPRAAAARPDGTVAEATPDQVAAVGRLIGRLEAPPRPTTVAAATARRPAAASRGAATSRQGLRLPVDCPFSSPFGPRWGVLHPGIDLACAVGTPVHAAAAGVVIEAAWQSGYGNLVLIDHGNGLVTAYGHNSRLAVAKGAHVAQGQVISWSGSTGFSTGPHLHFEVRIDGTPRQPLDYLPPIAGSRR